MIETEIKILLDHKSYLKVKEHFNWSEIFWQKNHYYVDIKEELLEKDITVRVREKENGKKLQVKTPVSTQNSMHIKVEHEFDIIDIPDVISEPEIMKLCGISCAVLFCAGNLMTERLQTKYDEFTKICLDTNTYLGVCDYELEIEIYQTKPQSLLDELERIGIHVNRRSFGKRYRFFTRKQIGN